MPFNLREFIMMVMAVSVFVCLGTAFDMIHERAGPIAAFFMVLSLVGLFFHEAYGGPGPVDIWQLQRQLMWASGQSLPDRPTLTRDSMLYVALTLEELAETAEVMARVIARDIRTGEHPLEIRSRLARSKGELMVAASQSLDISKNLRTSIANLDLNWSIPLYRNEAHDLLDGTSDVTVTAAGIPLASGLPAPLAYLEVMNSNLSKINPETGRIEKDATGKWIKGRKYVAPDLHSVLDQA